MRDDTINGLSYMINKSIYIDNIQTLDKKKCLIFKYLIIRIKRCHNDIKYLINTDINLLNKYDLYNH